MAIQSIFEQEHFIALFDTRIQAENAIKQLLKSAYDLDKLSIIGKDYRNAQQVVQYFNPDDRVKFWGRASAIGDAIRETLFHSARMKVAGFGRLLIAGPFVTTLIGAIERRSLVSGLGAMGAALYCLGIPRNAILDYEAALKANRFMLMVHGTEAETLKANYILDAAIGQGLHQSATRMDVFTG